MATTAQETDQITRPNLYVEGVRDGDAAKLRNAFHPAARVWGSMAGERYDEPIAELIARARVAALKPRRAPDAPASRGGAPRAPPR